MITDFISENQGAIIQFLAVLIVGYILIGVIVNVFNKSSLNEKVDTTVGKFFVRLIKFMLYSIYVIVLISMLGVPMTTFIAMLSAIGLAIALALQSYIANFASALVILFFKPFEVGDFIQTSTDMGTVKEIQLLFTHLITPDNRKIIVPNSTLVTDNVTNYSSEENRRVELVFSASYDDDIHTVIKAIKDVIHSIEEIHHDPEPIVRLANHGDFGLEYDVKVWVKGADYWPVKYQLNEDVRIAFANKSITIPTPKYKS